MISHLEDLRKTLIYSGLAVVICAIPCGYFWKEIFNLIVSHTLKLCEPLSVKIIYTAPVESVMLSIKIAVICGLMLASPIIFMLLWSFISPALYKKEKVLILPSAIASSFCFLSGVAFSYYTLPIVLQFLTNFASGTIEPFFRVDEYFGFLIKMSFAFGASFQLPVVAFVLSKIGIIDYKFLLKNFRYAIILIFILAAVLTPPDILSQTMLATPLLILYLLSIFISFLVGKTR